MSFVICYHTSRLVTPQALPRVSPTAEGRQTYVPNVLLKAAQLNTTRESSPLAR
jgi:hypothetical protein